MERLFQGFGFGLQATAGLLRYKQAGREYQQQKIANQVNLQRTQQELTSTYRVLEKEQSQVAENAIADSIDAQKARAISAGATVAEAGASGMTGSAVDKTVSNSTMESASQLSRISLSKERHQSDINMQAESAMNLATNRIQLMPQPEKPNPWAHLVGAGGRAFMSYNSIAQMQKNRRLASRI